MGWLGMELGSEAGLLQSRLLERLGKPLSSATLFVSSATDRVGQSSGIPRQLGLSSPALSSAKLPSTETGTPGKSPRRPSSNTRQTNAGQANTRQANTREAHHSRKTGQSKPGKADAWSRRAEQARDTQ